MALDDYTKNILYSLMAGINARQSQMLVGNPGLGKSALVRNLAENMLKCNLVTIIGSQSEPTDITGFPRLVEHTMTDGTRVSITEYALPWWQFKILQEKKIVLFLDEFSNSTPAVQAAMLMILNEREFANGMKIPDETVIIGAMNPVATAADGNELSLPVVNRLKFLPWEPSYDTWSRGLVTNWGHPERVSKEEMYWRKEVIAFLNTRPDLLYKLPDHLEEDDPSSMYGLTTDAEKDIYNSAYPSNRSWTNLAKTLAYCRGNETVENLSANGIVGYEAATAFFEFVRNGKKLPDVRDVLADPSIVPWDRIDMNSAQTLISGAVKLAGDDAKYADQLGNMFLYLAGHGGKAYASGQLNEVVRIITGAHNPRLNARILQAYHGTAAAAR